MVYNFQELGRGMEIFEIISNESRMVSNSLKLFQTDKNKREGLDKKVLPINNAQHSGSKYVLSAS